MDFFQTVAVLVLLYGGTTLTLKKNTENMFRAGTGYSLEDLQGVMDDRDWWWEG